jgi:hypothetical protein
MGQKTGLWQTHRDEELRRQKWNYCGLWQATPLTTINKRLHTPRTTDWMYTRQDKWIQKELVFTSVKNATQPNPFKIIPLQSTTKQNWENGRNVGGSSCNSGDGTAQMPQPLMFMMMITDFNLIFHFRVSSCNYKFVATRNFIYFFRCLDSYTLFNNPLASRVRPKQHTMISRTLLPPLTGKVNM